MNDLLGLVRIEKEVVLKACDAHIADKKREMEKEINEKIEKEQEKARKGVSFFGLFYLEQPKELTREEIIEQWKAEKNYWGCSVWNHINMHGEPGSSSAYKIKNAALNCNDDYVYVSIGNWSWLSSWIPKENKS